MPPSLLRVDHIHLFVTDRASAIQWYGEMLNFKPIAELEFWAASAEEPLTIGSPDGSIRFALFQAQSIPCRSTIALGATGEEFLAWREYLSQKLGVDLKIFDHEVAWSLYFDDPDGNPFEITTHDYAIVASAQSI